MANWEFREALPKELEKSLKKLTQTGRELSLKQLRDVAARSILEVQTQVSAAKLGYVSGVISGQGDENIQRNIRELGEWTKHLRTVNDFPLFAPPDIFTSDVYKNLKEMKLPRDDREIEFDAFWKWLILNAGLNGVTDIFMTPGWENGRGTHKELAVAKEKKSRVHIVRT